MDHHVIVMLICADPSMQVTSSDQASPQFNHQTTLRRVVVALLNGVRVPDVNAVLDFHIGGRKER
jgi:hypothetical protein